VEVSVTKTAIHDGTNSSLQQRARGGRGLILLSGVTFKLANVLTYLTSKRNHPHVRVSLIKSSNTGFQSLVYSEGESNVGLRSDNADLSLLPLIQRIHRHLDQGIFENTQACIFV
jgi:hypothetical protein